MDKTQAIHRIEAVFSQYKALRSKDTAHLQAFDKGKLYELYVLSDLVRDLTGRGFKVAFLGSDIVFKAAPGKIKGSDPHFRVYARDGSRFRLFVDIEFETMGTLHSHSAAPPDLSSRNEIDLLLVDKCGPYPTHREILLGVECKSVGNFGKHIVKEALGIRRELSLLADSRPSRLTIAGSTRAVNVPAKPASEFWLAYDDPKGSRYRSSPSLFGIEFRHIQLPRPRRKQ